MADGNFILTQEGKDKLEEELHFLETEKRAEIGERIKVAREFGDISENSEYDDAKNEQGMMEARIAEISRILSEATVVNTPKAMPPPARSPTSPRWVRCCWATRRATWWRPRVPPAARSP